MPTSHQLVDLLTTSLSHSRHAFLLDKIDVQSPSSILWGCVDSLSIRQKQSVIDHAHASQHTLNYSLCYSLIITYVIS